jgi:hypothetical protein
MKICMIKDTYWNRGMLLKGEEYDLRNDAAAKLVKDGAATYVEQSSVATPPETAVSRGKSKRRKSSGISRRT